MASLASQALSFLFVAQPVGWFAVARVTRAFLPISAEERSRCDADPARWVLRGPGWEAWAYDPATGLSANPEAPALDPYLRLRARVEDEPVRFLAGPDWGGSMWLPMGGEGACAALQVRWSKVPGRARVAYIAAGVGTLAGALATAVALVLAVRPLVARLARLRQAAETVGSPAYTPPGDEGPDDLGVVARVLDDAHARVRGEIEAQEARRRSFEQHLAEVAHDLRTPLAALQLRIEALARADAAPPEAGASRSAELAACLDDVLYLTLLVENLQALARLRVEAPHAPDSTDLRAVVRRVEARFGLLATRHGVTLAASWPDEPVLVAAAPVLVEQAVANLVHNAVVHHRAGGHVALVLERVGKTGFRLVVADDGPGMPPALLAAFAAGAPLTEAARQRSSHGMGLGLQVVRGVCARVGWRVTLTPEAPAGLTARVEGESPPG